MRLDRIATLGLFHPVSRVLHGREAASVILMYHSISDDQESGVHPYFRVNTAPAVFARQMALLQETGWSVVPLAELLAPDARAAEPGVRRVAITFDDGYEDFLLAAFPVLQRHGYPSSVFLPTDYIGDQPIAFKGRRCLTWGQVRELANAGVEFGSHTASHPQLHGLAPEAREEELRRSKSAIEQRLGRGADGFCYPYAFPQHDAAFRDSLRGALARGGYAYGVCTVLGRVRQGDDRYFAPRLPVNSLDDDRLLRAKLEGGYDWLQGVQHAAKALRRKVS
jgi:peptidoglycan/xylan/chitin deacetylase (PgdA/CDA1 family)